MSGMSTSVTREAAAARTASAYEACAGIARREGKNFAWGFRFLPPDQRAAMNALYAFARRTDDIVDEENQPREARARAIAEWRGELAAALDGGDSPNPILIAMADAARRFAVPREELMLLVEGCEDDLTVSRYATMEETLGYCRKVAVTVGLAMLAIFGARGERTREAMMAIGYAFQLTNILRDVPEDWARDRVYLPRDLMKRHGVSDGTIEVGCVTVGLRGCLREIADRADAYYRDARPLYSELPRPAARSMAVMGRIYGGILDEIRRQDYDVWSRRPRLSTLRKFGILAGTWMGL